MRAAEIICAVERVTKKWAKQRRAEERSSNAQARRRRVLCSYRETYLKEAIHQELERAIEEASGSGRFMFPLRNLYYSTRRLIQKHTDKNLDFKYFDAVVKEWEQWHGIIDGMYRDPRGHLIEPHTDEKIPLGTIDARNYRVPDHLYDKVLIIEKRGFDDILQKSEIALRYDIAIASCQGYVVDVVKTKKRDAFAARFGHDHLGSADPHGYNICRKLGASTLRSRGVDAIDIGLNLAEAFDMGLMTESFYDRRGMPRGLILTDFERETFQAGTRVELNSLASDPDEFISYIERKLEENGCRRKLIPPKEVVDKEAKKLRDDGLESEIKNAIKAAIDQDELVGEITANLRRRVSIQGINKALRVWGKQCPPERWSAELKRQIADRVNPVRHRIEEMAIEGIAERIAER